METNFIIISFVDRLCSIIENELKEDMNEKELNKLKIYLNSCNCGSVHICPTSNGIVDLYKYSKDYKNKKFYQDLFKDFEGDSIIFETLYKPLENDKWNHHQIILEDNDQDIILYMVEFEKLLNNNKENEFNEILLNTIHEIILNGSIKCFKNIILNYKYILEKLVKNIINDNPLKDIEYFIPISLKSIEVFRILEQERLINYSKVVKYCVEHRRNKELLSYCLLKETIPKELIYPILDYNSGYCLKEIIDNINYKLEISTSRLKQLPDMFIKYLVENNKIELNKVLIFVILLLRANAGVKYLYDMNLIDEYTFKDALTFFKYSDMKINASVMNTILFYNRTFGIDYLSETLDNESKRIILRVILMNIHLFNEGQFNHAIKIIKDLEIKERIKDNSFKNLLEHIRGEKYHSDEIKYYLSYYIANEHVVKFLNGCDYLINGYQITLKDLELLKENELKITN